MASKKNYNKESKDENKKNISIEESKDETKKEYKLYSGKVKCLKLNVRSAPTIESEIIKILNKNDIVKIDLSNSDDTFYNIVFNGISGYCMAEYIEVI